MIFLFCISLPDKNTEWRTFVFIIIDLLVVDEGGAGVEGSCDHVHAF